MDKITPFEGIQINLLLLGLLLYINNISIAIFKKIIIGKLPYKGVQTNTIIQKSDKMISITGYSTAQRRGTHRNEQCSAI